MIKARRIAFFDLEGTLLKRAVHLDNAKVAASAWTLLAERLGPAALREEEASKDRWIAGGYASYLEWMEDTVRMLQRHHLDEETFFEVTNAVEDMPGRTELFEGLRNAGVMTAIISGGFKRLADRVQIEHRIDHSLAGCELFFKPNGPLRHWNLLPSDYQGKVDFMELLMRGHSVLAEHCVFVGDGKNDVALAKAVGFSIAFNAQHELRQVCSEVIDQPEGGETLTPVLDRILRHIAH